MSDWLFNELRRDRYRVIAADPPWRFRTWSETNQSRAVSRYYDLMTLDNIKALPVCSLAAPDCVLFLWAINPMLPHALETIKAWGFKFKTVAFTWAKRTPNDTAWHMGLGYWTRQNTEQCLLATRGNPQRLSKAVRQLIVSSRRAHSQKPDEVYERIEAMCSGPYCELFARRRRPGWDSWGNECPDDLESSYRQLTAAFRGYIDAL